MRGSSTSLILYSVGNAMQRTEARKMLPADERRRRAVEACIAHDAAALWLRQLEATGLKPVTATIRLAAARSMRRYARLGPPRSIRSRAFVWRH